MTGRIYFNKKSISALKTHLCWQNTTLLSHMKDTNLYKYLTSRITGILGGVYSIPMYITQHMPLRICVIIKALYMSEVNTCLCLSYVKKRLCSANTSVFRVRTILNFVTYYCFNIRNTTTLLCFLNI